MAAQIHLFRCLEDNIGALIRDPASGACATIDASDEAAIAAALEETGWELTDCLITHSHWDHVQGLEALKARTGCRIVAPASAGEVAETADTIVREGDSVCVGEMAAVIWETPGHCADHIVYHFATDHLLIAGDVLFVMGCGRVFGGDFDSLHRALERVRALPDETVAIVGHDYTLANARFALKVEPHNAALVERAREAQERAEARDLFGMTTIGEEKATNPFLRVHEPAVAEAVGLAGGAPDAVFRALREWKNRG